MADPRRLSMDELRSIITDRSELAKGTQIYDGQLLAHLARWDLRLFAEAKGSGSTPYRVSILVGDEVKARCTCMAARSRPFCKHASALLVAWARSPESFAVSDAAPPEVDGGQRRSRQVKKGRRDAADLMKSGVDQVSTLARELGVSGIASVSAERLDQLRTLGESLRENRLRRLSARCLDLAAMLEGAGRGGVDDVAYANLLADMVLTAARLEKHLAGDALQDRYVEELIGKTWRKTDRTPVADLDLVEYSFRHRVTSDAYVIRESRFVDVASGQHYGEKQILPAFLDKRTTPKRSYAGKLLRGAAGSIYPGFAPLRLDLEQTGEEVAAAGEVLERLVDCAVDCVGSAVEKFQGHRRDVFAPDHLPISLRVDTLLAVGGRIQIVDDKGAALHLPSSARLDQRLGELLRGAALAAIVGDIWTDGALPTLTPLAAVIRGRGGLELADIADRDHTGPARDDSPRARGWASVAREAGLSSVAISLGEVREELAQALVAGLTGLGPRTAEPLAARLSDLGLAKPAAVLNKLADTADAHARLGDFVKLYQVLELAMLRLASATQVDRATVQRVPTFDSVYVVRPDQPLPPQTVRTLRDQGALNPYEAAVHYTAYYASLPIEALVDDIRLWSDGNATPYIARTVAERGEHEAARAIDVARERLISGWAGRTAAIAAVRVLQAVGGEQVERLLWEFTRRKDERDSALRGIAADALVDLRAGRDPTPPVRERRDLLAAHLPRWLDFLASAGEKEDRATAIAHLAELGSVRAIPALREAFWRDPARDVRDAAALALAELGDGSMVEDWIRQLAGDDDRAARTAAYALGRLGDERGLAPLLEMYVNGWKPGVIAEALARFGQAALEAIIDLLERHPELCKRKALLNVGEWMPPEVLSRALIRRIERSDVVAHGIAYLALAGQHEQTAREIGALVLRAIEGRDDADAKPVRRAARRASKSG